MALAVIVCPLPGVDATAQAETARHDEIDIPSLPLADALEVLARQTGVSVGVDGDLPNIRTPALHHLHGAGRALTLLLAGTDREAKQVGATAWRIVRRAPPPARPISSMAPRIEVGEESVIVVTATKQKTSQFNAAQAISVLRLARGDRHNPAHDTSYVASEVDGLNLTALGPGRNRLFLRGVADSPFNDANQSPVAVVLDETRLTYSAPDPDLRLVDVERVELLKGPQGALYGLGTLGGVYHIVTTKPDLEHFMGSVSAGLSIVTHGTGGEGGSAVANIPIVPGRIAMRLVGYDSREPGWIDTNDRQNGNFTKVNGGRAGLAVDLGASWRADLGVVTQHLDTSDSQYTYQVGSFARPAQLPEPHDNDFDHYSLRLAGDIGGLKAVLLGGYTTHEVSDTFDATTGAAAFGVAKPRLFVDERNYRFSEAELRVSGTFSGATWLMGVARVAGQERGVRTLSSFDPGLGMTIDSSLRKIRETGLFGQVDVPLTGRIGLEIGGRAYRSAQRSNFTGAGQNLTQASNGWTFTPAVALSWRSSAQQLLYLHFGTAARPGATDFSWKGKVRQLVGDDVRTLEAGWRQGFAGGGDLEVVGFATWWRNIQTDHVLPNGLIAAHNAGDARIIGAEGSLSLPLANGWRASTGVTVQEAQSINASPTILAHHLKLPAIPTYTLRSGFGREFPVGPAVANVKLNLRYLGPANLGLDPVLNRSTGHVLTSRLNAGLVWGRTRFDLELSNLLNRLDNRFAYGNPFRLRTPQYTPQRPFGASFAITRSF
ncbi:MAG: TonB-dependent receptor [Pseudomonadota bacterium]